MGKKSQGPDRKVRDYSPAFAEEDIVLGAQELGISSFVVSLPANTGRWNLDLRVPIPNGFAVIHSLGEIPAGVWATPVGVTWAGVGVVEITNADASACYLYGVTAHSAAQGSLSLSGPAMILPVRIIAIAP